MVYENNTKQYNYFINPSNKNLTVLSNIQNKMDAQTTLYEIRHYMRTHCNILHSTIGTYRKREIGKGGVWTNAL